MLTLSCNNFTTLIFSERNCWTLLLFSSIIKKMISFINSRKYFYIFVMVGRHILIPSSLKLLKTLKEVILVLIYRWMLISLEISYLIELKTQYLLITTSSKKYSMVNRDQSLKVINANINLKDNNNFQVYALK
jgi:hypothetical protein